MRMKLYNGRRNIIGSWKFLVGTWNVAKGRATSDFLILWRGSAAADICIVVVGVQEVEMGAGFLAMSAAKETVPVSIADLGGTEIGFRFTNPKQGCIAVIVASVLKFADGYFS